MEHYDSLSGDRADEREQRFYRLVYSFDHTAGDSRDAVGNEDATPATRTWTVIATAIGFMAFALAWVLYALTA